MRPLSRRQKGSSKVLFDFGCNFPKVSETWTHKKYFYSYMEAPVLVASGNCPVVALTYRVGFRAEGLKKKLSTNISTHFGPVVDTSYAGSNRPQFRGPLKSDL